MSTAEPELSTSMIGRYQHLTDQAARLRGRTSSDTHRWLFIAGGVGISLGLCLVVLGYVGASRTIYVFEQIPYLISGGILGGCLVIAGGFAYFGYWLTKLHGEIATSRAIEERQAASLERVELLLQSLLDVQTTTTRKKAS